MNLHNVQVIVYSSLSVTRKQIRFLFKCKLERFLYSNMQHFNLHGLGLTHLIRYILETTEIQC